MHVEDMQAAKRSLALRECRRQDRRPVAEDIIQRFMNNSCGYWTIAGESRGQCANVIGEWAVPRNLLAVVWTDFTTKFNGIDGQTPTCADVVEFLRRSRGQERQSAMDYITRTPRQISTDHRHQIEAELGWLPTGIV
jgi:hypothetical protein